MTRTLAAVLLPAPRIARDWTDPLTIEMVVDSLMVAEAERMGYDKCLHIGCPVMIVPAKNLGGLCQYHHLSKVQSR